MLDSARVGLYLTTEAERSLLCLAVRAQGLEAVILNEEQYSSCMVSGGLAEVRPGPRDACPACIVTDREATASVGGPLLIHVRDETKLGLEVPGEEGSGLTIFRPMSEQSARRELGINLRFARDFRRSLEAASKQPEPASVFGMVRALRGSNTVELEKGAGGFGSVPTSSEVEEMRERYTAIVDSSDDAIIGKDGAGMITTWNRGAEKIFGYTADEILGKSIRLLLLPGLEAEEDEILSRIRRGEAVQPVEVERRRKDGETIQVSLTVSPIRNSSGQVTGGLKIARDITQRKRIESRMRQIQKMEALGQLTGGVAHDFNNLLGVIMGNLDLLESHVAGNAVALKRLRTAQKGATRGADITRRLLSLSSDESLRPVSTSLNHAVRNTIDMASRVLEAGIRVNLELDSTVPLVFVDPSALESALLNLAMNSRDAMPEGGTLIVRTRVVRSIDVDLQVRADEMRDGCYACVEVSDDGHGMSREIQEQVFEPFFTTKAREKGTGLGLAMVYGFVNQSRGGLRLTSERGAGTSVTIYLPLATSARN